MEAQVGASEHKEEEREAELENEEKTNRERVCCCSLPWLGSVDAFPGVGELLGKPRMEGGLGEGGREREKNTRKTVLERGKRG